jgi:hypothetical protein
MDLPEFRTTGEGYSPDKYYVRSVDENHEKTSMSIQKIDLPPWLSVLVHKLVGDDRWPDYRSTADVVRDGLGQIVQRRLMEAGDEEYMRMATRWGRWLEQDRLLNEARIDPAIVARWEAEIPAVEDPEQRAFLVLAARADAEQLPKYWRDKLIRICDLHG